MLWYHNKKWEWKSFNNNIIIIRKSIAHDYQFAWYTLQERLIEYTQTIPDEQCMLGEILELISEHSDMQWNDLDCFTNISNDCWKGYFVNKRSSLE